MSGRSRALGACAIALAILFNVPYAILAATFDYPAILREPAAEVLLRFAAGGPLLVLTWYGFALAALALTPLAIGLSITPDRLARMPALALTAAMAGALAGVTQAIGLLRWVFVMPDLSHAAAQGDPVGAATAASTFHLINAYGGIAIGEHLGQLLTALFVGVLAIMQGIEGDRMTRRIGLGTAALMATGTGEGLMIATGHEGSLFALATIAGFLGLTVWLIMAGTMLLRRA